MIYITGAGTIYIYIDSLSVSCCHLSWARRSCPTTWSLTIDPAVQFGTISTRSVFFAELEKKRERRSPSGMNLVFLQRRCHSTKHFSFFRPHQWCCCINRWKLPGFRRGLRWKSLDLFIIQTFVAFARRSVCARTRRIASKPQVCVCVDGVEGIEKSSLRGDGLGSLLGHFIHL